MSNYQAIWSHDGIRYFKATGTGTDSDPFIPVLETSGESIGSEFDTVSNFTVNIGSTSTLVRSAVSTRKILALVNNSDVNIFIHLGSAAVLNSGIRLNANGGSLVLADPVWKGTVYAITASSGQLVGIDGE